MNEQTFFILLFLATLCGWLFSLGEIYQNILLINALRAKPIAKIRSAAQGYVKLKGTVQRLPSDELMK